MFISVIHRFISPQNTYSVYWFLKLKVTLSSLVTPEVVVTTTSGATSDGKVGIMTVPMIGKIFQQPLEALKASAEIGWRSQPEPLTEPRTQKPTSAQLLLLSTDNSRCQLCRHWWHQEVVTTTPDASCEYKVGIIRVSVFGLYWAVFMMDAIWDGLWQGRVAGLPNMHMQPIPCRCWQHERVSGEILMIHS